MIYINEAVNLQAWGGMLSCMQQPYSLRSNVLFRMGTHLSLPIFVTGIKYSRLRYVLVSMCHKVHIHLCILCYYLLQHEPAKIIDIDFSQPRLGNSPSVDDGTQDDSRSQIKSLTQPTAEEQKAFVFGLRKLFPKSAVINVFIPYQNQDDQRNYHVPSHHSTTHITRN